MQWIDLEYHYVGIPTDEKLNNTFANLSRAVAEKEKEGDPDVHVGIVINISVKEEVSEEEFKALEERIRLRLQAAEARDKRGRYEDDAFVVKMSYSSALQYELELVGA